MHLNEILRMINFIIALITLYPSVKLAICLIRERREQDRRKGMLSTRLSIIFITFIIMAVVNAVLYLVAILGIDGAHNIATLRSTVINFLFAWGIWGLYLFQRDESK